MLNFRYPDVPLETTPEVVRTLSTSNWWAQNKYDGWHMSIYYDAPGKVRCLSRQANEMEKIARAKFTPQFIEELGQLVLPPNTVLDAEFVGPRGNHKPAIYIFDCLAKNGDWLSDIPFEKRWEICNNLPELPSNVQLAETVYDDFLGCFNMLKDDWLKTGDLSLTEGIVLKHKQGKLDLSLRSSTKNNRLLKVKFRDCKEKKF